MKIIPYKITKKWKGAIIYIIIQWIASIISWPIPRSVLLRKRNHAKSSILYCQKLSVLLKNYSTPNHIRRPVVYYTLDGIGILLYINAY